MEHTTIQFKPNDNEYSVFKKFKRFLESEGYRVGSSPYDINGNWNLVISKDEEENAQQENYEELEFTDNESFLERADKVKDFLSQSGVEVIESHFKSNNNIKRQNYTYCEYTLCVQSQNKNHTDSIVFVVRESAYNTGKKVQAFLEHLGFYVEQERGIVLEKGADPIYWYNYCKLKIYRQSPEKERSEEYEKFNEMVKELEKNVRELSEKFQNIRFTL